VFIVIKLDLVKIKFHFKLDFYIKIILFYLKKQKGWLIQILNIYSVGNVRCF
jgi:hypothetical protein